MVFVPLQTSYKVTMNNRYMLITVLDREIYTEVFCSLEEAQDAMHKEMILDGNVEKDIFGEEEYDDGDCGFGKFNGYSNIGDRHEECDWLIVLI